MLLARRTPQAAPLLEALDGQHMKTLSEAKSALEAAWPKIKNECIAVLGSELHYQAMIYHLLRQHGNVPLGQLGMNVKMWIDAPVSPPFSKV